MNIHLILGGARSGKSRLAEKYALDFEVNHHQKICYIATAEAHDAEMSARIIQHQNDRPQHWQLIESPLNLAQALEQALKTNPCVLVDCLTLWLTNCLCHQDKNMWPQQKSALLAFLKAQLDDKGQHQKNIIFVSNEVGHGIVPMGELSREFVDQAGWLHQELAELAQQVDFVMAGIPLRLKPQVKVAVKDNK
jgi:adenosylcobinamide kinase/adenosylcobinamide-phosphate guanylyltransferase